METLVEMKDNQPFDCRSHSHDLCWKTVFSGDGTGEAFDCELRKILNCGLERVQSVLDQNTALIQQVNQNHQSKNPAILVKNAALIHEINDNISKVLSIYSDLSIDFTNLVRRSKFMSKNCDYGGKEMVDADKESDKVLEFLE